MSFSSFTLSGTLTKDPEKRLTPSNIPVTNLFLEVTYMPRGQYQQENITSQTIRVNAWRDLAEECEKNLKAGDKLLVIGRVQINSYTSNEGKKKKEVEVDATSITLLNDVMNIQPPLKKDEEKQSTGKSSFKRTSQDVEQVSSVDEVINTEEIPF